ncbi:uncharacterized protein LOC126908546 [Daktulosphaira vitifoliae]|uniref:uncharacterized protein LOC126908546 n=1 Tax=Daktulosphaira vitifoliae TaxID=58002 RepID=UPI0021AA7DDD|nr:uncharacterized protein LOC126908546 [Daktulosphaira vitifoliae]
MMHLLSISNVILLCVFIKKLKCNKIDLDNLDVVKVHEYIEKNKPLMDLTINGDTIYTQSESFLSDRKFYIQNQRNIDLNTPPVENREIGIYKTTEHIIKPNVANSTNGSRELRILDHIDGIPVIGSPLGSIMEQILINVDTPNYLEAIIWLQNVIESIGISGVTRYCEITTALLNTQTKVSILHKKYSTFIQMLENLFYEYRLFGAPIKRLIEIIAEYEKSPESSHAKKSYSKSCVLLAKNYSKYTRLVNAFVWKDVLDLTTTKQMKDELEYVIASCYLKFNKTYLT